MRRFLRATARGFQYAAAHPERTADMLLAAAPDLDARLVHASQALVSKVRAVLLGLLYGLKHLSSCLAVTLLHQHSKRACWHAELHACMHGRQQGLLYILWASYKGMLILQNYLDKDGRWGTMEAPRWEAFLDWLSEKGLLTSAMPSRSPVEGESASLDELRQGKAGERIPREAVKSESLFTNGFLPQGQ